MKVFLIAMLASAVSAATLTDYGLGGAGSISASASSASSGGGYGGRTERRCTPYFDTVQDERCEAYTERTCITTQRESCREVPDQNCRALVSSKQIRQCFNVTEERCQLKEDVQFETIQVPFVVQKCVKVNERICDTVYETSSSQKDNLQCIQIENPSCQSMDRTINDVTCRTTTQFDCDQSYGSGSGSGSGFGSGSGSGFGSGSSGGSSGGAVDAYGNPIGGGSSGGYGSNMGGSGGAVDAYGNPIGGGSSGGDFSSHSGYGQQETACRRKQETKCYKTPRTVSVQQCAPKREKVCERLPESVPFAQAKQSCRNEEKKVCELEERLQPKQVKKYVYSTQCRPVPRSVCDNADRKQLVPSCVGTTRKECSFSPSESCQDEPKQHCYQVSRQVKKERCETIQVPAYPAPQPGYPAPQPNPY